MWVPFPFVERTGLRMRPALLLACPSVPEHLVLGWVAMITSKNVPAWPGDIFVGDRHRECGLPFASTIRLAKITTVDLARATSLGSLPDDLWREVKAVFAGWLAIR